MQPIIKWSGSKRSQAKEILRYIPKEVETYYEPFLGGGSILLALLEQKEIKIKRYIVSDINNDLIDLWLMIKNNPKELADGYRQHWNNLNCDNDRDRRLNYYNQIRKQFNEHRNSIDFMFIDRTTTNGLIRYNKQGNFNNSFHFSRKGILPDTLEKLIERTSQLLNEYNVEFINQSYVDIKTKKGDFIYADPPYANTKGMYFGGIDLNELFKWFNEQYGEYIMSFDGIRGEDDLTYEVPKEIYTNHVYIKSGKSSFSKIKEQKDIEVFESLYIK